MTRRIVIDTNVFIEGVFGEETSDSAILLASLDELGDKISIFSRNNRRTDVYF